MIQRKILLVALRRHADPAGEQALEMRGAHPHLRGEILQREGGAGIVDQVDRAAHDVVMIAVTRRIDHRGGFRAVHAYPS